MKPFSLSLALALLFAGVAGAQTSMPEAGLAAEGEGRWADAVVIYRRHAAQQSGGAELWMRIAEIESGLGRGHEVIAALQRAAEAAPADASILAKLSQAYAAEGHATPALRAIEGALALRPGHDADLRAHATIATWAGEYQAAARSYRTLLQGHPDEAALALGLARVSVWDGRSDAAADAYRAYLRSDGADPAAWLELARTESWRGNTPGAMTALEAYRERLGRTDGYRRERVGVLARGGRPLQALREIEPLLAENPGDFDLRLSRTIALAAARRHGPAASSLNVVHTLRPGHADGRAAEALVRSWLGSNAGPTSTFYSDSDGLRSVKFAPRADIGFTSNTRLSAGYERVDLRARAGSGLDGLSGATTATLEQGWAGLSQRVGPLTVGGTVGHAQPDGYRLTTYSGFARFAPVDAFSVTAERSSGFATISPRTVRMGLTRLAHRAQLEWNPALRYHLALEGSFEELSDGNTRWEVYAGPRVAMMRTQRLNLDLGLLAHQFGADKDLDNGYYDPRRYESYSVVLSPYFKVSENIGLALTAGAGVQRDNTARSFELGTNAAAEATFGIYGPWLLKVHGATTNNRRLDSGAFRGVSGGVGLMRRF